MKIGYYIPTIKDLPVPGVDYRQKRYRLEGSEPIKWKSDLGLKFVESLFAERNLSLPKYNSESCIKYHPSFKSLQDFFLFLKLYRTIEHSKSLYYNYKRSYPFAEGGGSLVGKLLDLKKEISNPENNLLKDESFQTKLENNIKHCDRQENILRELIQNLEEKALNLSGDGEFLIHGLYSFWSLWERDDEIQIRGFKLSEQIYEHGNLFSDLGYSSDALENDMKLLKVFNSEHRNNSNNSLNTFYKVIRTNDPKDILYLSRERSKNNEEKIILVFRTHEILKKNSFQVDEHIRGSDNVYFRKFHTHPKTGVVSLIVSNGRMTGHYEEDKELNFGILFIYDPKTGKGMTSDHPTIQHFEKVLVDNYVLEGYKLSDKFAIDSATGKKTSLRWVENGVMGKPCSACDLIPCDCQIILDWEKYLDPSDSAQTGRPYWGFSRDRYLELGMSPKDIETEYDIGNPLIDNIPGREYDQMRYFNENIKDGDSGSLNWGRYNDQLDMDQQSQDFWEEG
jgi:hypothetical protein